MRVGTNLTQAGLSPPRPFWPLLHNLGQIPTHTPYISYLLFLHFLLICLGFSFYFFLNLLPHNLGQIPTHTPYISYLCTLPAFPNYFSWIFFLLFLVFAATWPWTNTDIHTPPYILILIFTFSIGFSLDFKSTFAVSPVRFPMKCSFFLLCTSFFVLSL